MDSRTRTDRTVEECQLETVYYGRDGTGERGREGHQKEISFLCLVFVSLQF